jgi:D-alanyl-D-alanine carboxypeptidase
MRYRIWIAALVVSQSVNAYAQEDARLSARGTQPPDSAQEWQHTNQPEYPAGRFVVLPDNGGRTDFDPALASSLQRALDSVRATQGVEGASAAVLVPGQGVWLGVSGISSISPPANIDPAMLLGIGSNTKAFVSTTLLSLVDEGLLSLDDPLSKWLPPYPNITGSVTIRQLMNMTSGLFDYLNDSNAQGDSVAANPTRLWTPEELIATFVGPPHKPPGGAYSYCNTDYILLGMVIKNITGQSVSTQIRERVLTPLSLDHTYLEVEESHTEPVAHPWDNGYDFASIPVTAHFSTLWTAGGVISTAENMARWVKGLYEGAVISPAALGQMLTCVPMSSTAATGLEWNGYGLGVRRGAYYQKKVMGHAGAVMGYVSITGYLPQTGTSFVVLFNASEASTGAALTALLDAYLRSVSPNPARNGVCYAISGRADSSRIYLADTSTAALTVVGTPHYGDIVGARIDPRSGVLWGLVNANGWDLVQIDGEVGEAYPHVRVQFPAGTVSDFKGMAFSPEGTLYVGSVDGRIYAIDVTTGVAVLAVTSKISFSGLAFDPTTGSLWASIRTNPYLRDRIYKVDLVTGDTVGAGNTGFNSPLADLAFDAKGDLFGLVGNPAISHANGLARIDKATGVGAEIGSVGLTGMVGIAFSPYKVGTGVDLHTSSGIAAGFTLEQSYPNPFNGTSHVGFSVADESWVTLKVYDLLGREVAVLVNEEKQPGRYVVRWDANRMGSGAYLCRMTAGGFVAVRTMLLVK